MDKKITVLIIDDERRNTRSLQGLIDRYCPKLEVTGAAESALEALQMIDALEPDALFLDIKMPGMDGFDLLETLHRKDLMVVFVSAYDEHALQALKAGAVDYLLKPVSIKELRQVEAKLEQLHERRAKTKDAFSDYLGSLKQVTAQLQRDPNKITFSTDKGYFVDEIGEVIRMESDNNYVFVYRKDKERLLLSRSLSELERALPQDTFLRIHNSHLINLDFLDRFDRNDGGYVMLRDGSRLPVSRRKMPELLKHLKTRFRPV